ncbi:MAG: FMN-binding negative transcriptional regulator [Paracoccus sp. (in: a-proteobacteria)]
MYCPPAFAENRPEIMAALIRDNPLGLLITADAGGPCANALPFELSADSKRLRAHLARANPQLDQIRAGHPVLVVFQGEQSYISPNYYATKPESGRVVPTWNYLMVQVNGASRLHEDADWLGIQTEALTAQMEAGQATPWSLSDAPDKFIDAQLRGIVGLEIDITAMRGKWKASQNRLAADRQSVADALVETHPTLAALAAQEIT